MSETKAAAIEQMNAAVLNRLFAWKLLSIGVAESAPVTVRYTTIGSKLAPEPSRDCAAAIHVYIVVFVTVIRTGGV